MKPCAVTQLLVSLAVMAFPTAGQSPVKADAENGRKLFVADGCYQCHGLQGQGGSSAPIGSYGTRLAPPKLTAAGIRAYIRHPSGGMPPYTAKVISDSQIEDIYAFLKTIPVPPPVRDIPLLNQ